MRSNKRGRENEDGETRRNVTNEDAEALAFSHVSSFDRAMRFYT